MKTLDCISFSAGSSNNSYWTFLYAMVETPMEDRHIRRISMSNGSYGVVRVYTTDNIMWEHQHGNLEEDHGFRYDLYSATGKTKFFEFSSAEEACANGAFGDFWIVDYGNILADFKFVSYAPGIVTLRNNMGRVFVRPTSSFCEANKITVVRVS